MTWGVYTMAVVAFALLFVLTWGVQHWVFSQP